MTLEQLCAARDEIIMANISRESQEAAYALFTAAILELRDEPKKK